MKKIINPWENVEGYNCFGCAPQNPSGLKMEFYEDGKDIVSYWKPDERFQGWLNTLHGGIQATLLDEICGWVIMRKLQTAGVTTKMEIRYLKPVHTDDKKLTLRASIREQKKKYHCNRSLSSQQFQRTLHTSCLFLFYFLQRKSMQRNAFSYMRNRRKR